MIDVLSGNCDVCGTECIHSDLDTIHLSGFDFNLNICLHCKNKQPEDHYKMANSIINNILNITKEPKTAEERLDKIKKLLIQGK